MSSDRPNQTLADYVALAICPALIMGLVASLVFFLVNVLYAGEFVERLRWILFFFVFGAVLIARMTMRDDTSSRAALNGVPLGILTWLGMQMFVEYPEGGGIRELSWVLNAGLIGLVWWCAHRLTWDCTNVDEETDINAEGLLQAAGLENERGETKSTTKEEKPKEREGFWQRWRRYQEGRRKKRTLGVWVVYFSLAALPLFGLGQALIDAGDLERRRASFWLMIVYVGCGLGLLLTTCFLGLRRYLRQRRLKMPVAMTSVWLTAGGLLIAALLVIGAVLPRPDAEYSLFNLTPTKSPKRSASKYAMKGDRPGEGEGRPGADDPDNKKNSPDSGGQKGEQKGERGDPARQGKNGSGGQDGKSGQGEKQGQNSGKSQNSRDSGEKQNKGDAGSGRDQTASKDNNKQIRGDNDNRSSADEREQKSNGERSERANSSSSSSSKLSASALRDFVGRVSPVLKWIVFGVLGLAVLFFVLRSGLRFLANFSDWARRLLDALRNFWANLFGGWNRTKEKREQDEETERTIPERPFASFHNPFEGGRAGMAVPELVRYTFAAAQAWARERDLGRQPGETPLEFAQRVGMEVPALEADLHRLAVLYARAVYSRGGLPSNSVEVLRHFWQRLQTVAEQPLSA
jgi:hypothetical protein